MLGAIIMDISLIPSYYIVTYALCLENLFVKLLLIAFSYFVFGMFIAMSLSDYLT